MIVGVSLSIVQLADICLTNSFHRFQVVTINSWLNLCVCDLILLSIAKEISPRLFTDLFELITAIVYLRDWLIKMWHYLKASSASLSSCGRIVILDLLKALSQGLNL